MAETRPHQRVFALIIAVLFFAFSFGLSFVVIWQIYQDHHKKGASSAVTATTPSQNTSQNAQQDQPSGKLEGTQLANFTPVAHVDQLQVTDQTVGTGATLEAGDNMEVDYTGAVAATGVIFQSSLDSGQHASLNLNQVIDGWKQGMLGMKVGGKRRLLIPAAQAYGANPPAGIPANADLVFDVTLYSVSK